MVTKYKKPVRRLLGNLVVAIEENGLRVRRPRGRKSVLVPWKWFEQRFTGRLDFKAGRKQAFLAPLPPGWCPKPGDTVWVDRVPRTLCICVLRGLVVRVYNGTPEPTVRVRLRSAAATAEELLSLSQTRPLDIAAKEHQL